MYLKTDLLQIGVIFVSPTKHPPLFNHTLRPWLVVSHTKRPLPLILKCFFVLFFSFVSFFFFFLNCFVTPFSHNISSHKNQNQITTLHPIGLMRLNNCGNYIRGKNKNERMNGQTITNNVPDKTHTIT